MVFIKENQIAGISSDLYVRDAELPGITVASMPATGYLAEISRQKYGYRADRRMAGLKQLLESIKESI